MKQARALYDALKKITKADDDILPAIVKTVGEDTCDCEFDELLITDCRLKSITGITDGIKIKPAVNSIVLLKRIGDFNEFFVCMYSTIDETGCKIGTTEMKQSADGFLIKKDAATLKGILTNIVEATQQILVVYGNNPDYEKLTQALTDINNLLQ